MSKIYLKTPLGNSEILIQKKGLGHVHDFLKKHHPDSKILIITDTNLGELYRGQLEEVFPDAEILAVIAGEKSKKLANVQQIAGEMLDIGIGRNDVLIGFGGGVITDLAGFVASIYMRGMPFISIPTSLLGMVDAAIGGKTGVDTSAKNILGTFYPAELILIDSSFLERLPEKQLQIGLAEVIKYAGTLDASLEDDLMQDELPIDSILEKSAQAKNDIVAQDLREGGIRKVLNYGHTFGHAVEQLSDYKLSHGEAISIGMVLANRVAEKLGKQDKETGERIIKLLQKYDLPTELPEEMTVGSLAELIKKDKKRKGDQISFVLSTGMGRYEIVDLGMEELVDLAK